jgi:hypothetical protein
MRNGIRCDLVEGLRAPAQGGKGAKVAKLADSRDDVEGQVAEGHKTIGLYTMVGIHALAQGVFIY